MKKPTQREVIVKIQTLQIRFIMVTKVSDLRLGVLVSLPAPFFMSGASLNLCNGVVEAEGYFCYVLEQLDLGRIYIVMRSKIRPHSTRTWSEARF